MPPPNLIAVCINASTLGIDNLFLRPIMKSGTGFSTGAGNHGAGQATSSLGHSNPVHTLNIKRITSWMFLPLHQINSLSSG